MKTLKSHVVAGVGLALALTPPLAWGQGSGNVGGGDPCESRFLQHSSYLRDRIHEWIGNQVKFSAGWNAERYRSSMLEAIEPLLSKAAAAPKLECVRKKIKVDGVEKVCRGMEFGNGRIKIQCNRRDFLALEEQLQVRLVHHEWAQIKNIETNVGSYSDYSVSDQIIALLSRKTDSGGWELVDYPAGYCTYEYRKRVDDDRTLLPTNLHPKLAASLARLGCTPTKGRRSEFNHLNITSSGSPSGGYGAEHVDLVEHIHAKTTITNVVNGLTAQQYGATTAFFNFSIHFGQPNTIFLGRYDHAVNRAIQKSEALLAPQVSALLR